MPVLFVKPRMCSEVGVRLCRYFARLGRNQISVYETPDCTLLDKKSIKLENVQDFQWSPSAPILSACQAEQSSGNLPARIVLLKMPERTELRQKNLFSVSGTPLGLVTPLLFLPPGPPPLAPVNRCG